jgi:hypothetical protein
MFLRVPHIYANDRKEELLRYNLFLWIGFWLSSHQFLQGVPFFGTNRALLKVEQNLPARSRKRGEAPIPRMGKGLPGFAIERAPSHDGGSALDHHATPAARYNHTHEIRGIRQFWEGLTVC